MSKKVFFISTTLFAVFLGAYLVYHFFIVSQNASKNDPIVNNSQQNNQQNPIQNTQTSRTIKKIVDGKVYGATLSNDGSKIIYYQNQRILSASFDGATKDSLGAYPFNQVTEVIWSKNVDKAIIKDNDGIYIYSLKDDSAQKLREGVSVVAWSKMGDKIIYKYTDGNDHSSINVSDPDGQNWQELKKINFSRVDFRVNPKSGDICYFQTPDSFQSSQFASMGFDGQSQKLIFSDRFGANYLWSPDGSKILIAYVASRGGNRMETGVMNEIGGNFSGLMFPSMIEKCAWSKDSTNLYCAMMSAFPDEANLPNDWYRTKYFSADTFWEINTDEAKKDRLVEAKDITEEYDVDNLFLDREERYLFFSDKKNGGLYRIEL